MRRTCLLLLGFLLLLLALLLFLTSLPSWLSTVLLPLLWLLRSIV